MSCYNCGSEMSMDNYSKKKKLFDRDELAEEGGKPFIWSRILKINVEGHLKQAKDELDKIMQMEISAYDMFLRASKIDPGSDEEYAKRLSIVVSVYRHIGLAKIKKTTALKLAMKNVACGTLH